MVRQMYMSAPTLAGCLLEDLDKNASETPMGDRQTGYMLAARGEKEKDLHGVFVSLIERKANLPESNWHYDILVMEENARSGLYYKLETPNLDRVALNQVLLEAYSRSITNVPEDTHEQKARVAVAG